MLATPVADSEVAITFTVAWHADEKIIDVEVTGKLSNAAYDAFLSATE